MSTVLRDRNRLTLLTSSGVRAVKTFRQANSRVEEEGYGKAKLFTAKEIELDDSGGWLRKLGPKSNSFVVMGAPVNWAPGEKKRRLSSDRDGEAATLEDCPRGWMPIDIDHLDFEPAASIDDGETLALEVMNRLGLQGKHCVWHLTGSHGVNGKVRVRLWVRLAEPAACEGMRQHAKSEWADLVDLAVYRPAQPIYTGDPVFEGMDPPVRNRVGAIKGEPLKLSDACAGKGHADDDERDENIQLLKDSDLYIRQLRPGEHAIRCPWEDQHTEGAERDTDTVFLPAHFNGHDAPGFKCFHGHCEGKKWRDVLAMLGKADLSGKDTSASFQPVTVDGERIGAGQREVEDFVSFLPTHGYLFVPTMTLWPASSVDACVPRQKGAGKPVRASAWLDKHRPVHSMTWSPGEGLLIEGRVAVQGGWKADPNATSVNTYQPPKELDGDPEKAGPWVEHVSRVFPDNAEHIIKWCAHRVQQPGVKVNHALLLAGDQGVGKDTLLEPLKVAIGPWNFQEVGPGAILGAFNGFVKSVVLRVSEARDLGPTDRFGFYEHMKVYTAAPPDTLRCNEKHQREHYVFNVMGVVITTNHRSDGIYLPQDDRRHYVATSLLTKDDFAKDYWQSLWDWYRSENGFGHVAAYLRGIDLSAFDPSAPPPRTTGWHTIVAANNAPEDIELATTIEELGEPDAVTIEKLKKVAPADLLDYLTDPRHRRAIVHRLVAAGYVPVPNPDAKNGLWRFPAGKMAAYAKRALTPAEGIRAVRELIRSAPRIKRKSDDSPI